MTKLHWLLGCVLVVALGCGKTEDKVSTQAPVAPSGDTAQTAPETKGPSVSEVPTSLKTDAFDYYGLGSDKPVDFEMVGSGGTKTGARIVTLKSVNGDKAVFEVQFTGGLDQLGTTEYSLEPGGLFATKSSIGTLKDTHQLEVPAKLDVGVTWKSKVEATLTDNTQLKSDQIYKVVKREQVTTKAGKFDALRIDVTGNSQVGSQKTKDDLKIWLVKGVGPIKMDIKYTMGSVVNQNVVTAVRVGS
jgi:hypothetical protein